MTSGPRMENSKINAKLAAVLKPVQPTTRAAQFFEGFMAPWHGFQFIRRNPSLWPYAILAIVLNLLITTLVFIALVAAIAAIAVYVHPWFTQDQEGTQYWLWLTLDVLAAVMLFVLAVGTAMIMWKLLTGILVGYQNGKLAAQTEILLGMNPEDITSITFFDEVADTFLMLGSLLLTYFIFFLVGFIPIIGALIAIVGSTYRTWFLFGFDFIDYPLSLRGIRRADKCAFVRRHRAHTLGLGSAVVLLEFLPIINSVLLTTAVIGAVIVNRRLESQPREDATFRDALE